jgi:uncharacterized protein (TIGR01777 family)
MSAGLRVAVTGATGTIGSAVVSALRERGDEVTELSRGTNWPAPAEAPPQAETLRGHDAVVNLLGEQIAQRWSDRAKVEIRNSRVLGTRNLVAGLRALPEAERPKVLVSQSGVGYYGARGDEPLDESAPAGDDFLAHVVVDWEAEARAAEQIGVRVVVTRTGVVLSDSGGALGKMLPFFKAGVGGPVAGGRQYLPWVHLDDMVGAVLFALDTPELSGPVNLTAPDPATNKQFSRTLGRVLHRPAFAPVPALALKALYGEMAFIVTTGQRAVPKRLLDADYAFRRPDLEQALREVTRRRTP